MIRVIVRKLRDYTVRPWRATCPQCTGWLAIATTATDAIDVATRHANGHRSYP